MQPERAPEPPADAREDGAAALAGFLDKWHARWPEWRIAEVFVPAGGRLVATAWAALQQELTDAAWAGSDPRPGLAKLGWWQEELRGWERGARRHPLAQVLQPEQAPWGALAAALDSLPAARERPGDAQEAFAQVAPFAAATAAVDAALFGDGPADQAQDAVAAWLLQARFTHQGDAWVPLSAVAAAGGGGDPRRAWAEELLRQSPAPHAAPRPRRLWMAMARHRLESGDPGRPVPSWRVLLRAWRTARGL